MNIYELAEERRRELQNRLGAEFAVTPEKPTPEKAINALLELLDKYKPNDNPVDLTDYL